jgi:hypothetical protein
VPVAIGPLAAVEAVAIRPLRRATSPVVAVGAVVPLRGTAAIVTVGSFAAVRPLAAAVVALRTVVAALIGLRLVAEVPVPAVGDGARPLAVRVRIAVRPRVLVAVLAVVVEGALP